LEKSVRLLSQYQFWRKTPHVNLLLREPSAISRRDRSAINWPDGQWPQLAAIPAKFFMHDARIETAAHTQ
jgi:hypothetical protein